MRRPLPRLAHARAPLGVLAPLLLAGGAVAGCGSDHPAAVALDASFDALGEVDGEAPPPLVVAPPAPPAPPGIPWLGRGTPPVEAPAPPELGPCPAGWRELAPADGPRTCEPWPEGGRARCPGGAEAHFPGEETCRRIGPACPSGAFPEAVADDGGAVFVLAGAAPGGDGSPERPFATLAQGLAAVAGGGVVALGVGRYVEEVELPAGVALVGACVERTSVVGLRDPGGVAAVRVRGAGATIAAVELRDALGEPAVLVEGATASLELRGVLISDAGEAALRASDGARLVARDVVARSDAGARAGRGIELASGARAVLERVVIEGRRDRAVLAEGAGTSLEAAGLAVLGTLPSQAADVVARGVSLEGGAQASLQTTVIEGGAGAAIVVTGASSDLDAADLVVRGSGVGESEGAGGLLVADGAQARVARASVEGNGARQLDVRDAGSTLMVSDALVRGKIDGVPAARGLTADSGAALVLARLRIEGALERGVQVFQDAILAATDLDVRGTEEAVGALDRGAGASLVVAREATGVVDRLRVLDGNTLALACGAGATLEVRNLEARASLPGRDAAVLVEGGGGLRLERSRIEGARFVALAAVGGTLSVEDVAVLDTVPRDEADEAGRGVEISAAATATLTRLRVARAHDVGVLVQGRDVVLRASDVVVEDVEARLTDGAHGQGIVVSDGAGGELARVRVTRSTEGGLLSQNGALVTGTDVIVEEVRSTASRGELGCGLLALTGARMELERVRVRGARTIGALGLFGDLVLRDLEVAQTLAAACSTTSCADGSGGIGLMAGQWSTVAAERFVIDGAELCGVLVSGTYPGASGLERGGPGELDLAEGVVRGAPVGACVQVEGYELARLSTTVCYVDNGVNLQSTSYPPPRGIEELAGSDAP